MKVTISGKLGTQRAKDITIGQHCISGNMPLVRMAVPNGVEDPTKEGRLPFFRPKDACLIWLAPDDEMVGNPPNMMVGVLPAGSTFVRGDVGYVILNTRDKPKDHKYEPWVGEFSTFLEAYSNRDFVLAAQMESGRLKVFKYSELVTPVEAEVSLSEYVPPPAIKHAEGCPGYNADGQCVGGCLRP